MFYEKSPRNIDVESARQIVQSLPPQVEKVGVFVNEPVERILETVRKVGLTAAQLHGIESRKPEFIKALEVGRELKVFLVLPGTEVSSGLEWTVNGERSISGVFFDSGTPQQPGGTGTIFDWKAAASGIQAIGERLAVVVAGGLNSINVGDAIRILKPWGVDVVSGVEARPGKKDPQKVRAFVDAVRQAEKNN